MKRNKGSKQPDKEAAPVKPREEKPVRRRYEEKEPSSLPTIILR